MNKLSFNNKIYTILKKDVYNYKHQNLNDQLLIKKIEKLTRYAWNNFPGFLTDFEFENYLFNISKRSEIVSYKRAEVLNKNVVLHYATELYNSGGHSRVIKDWIKHDIKESNIFISQNHSVIPDFINELKCRVEKATKIDLLNRVKQFAEFIGNVNPGYIIIHNHPDDVIPTLIKPFISDIPFIFYNHADFQFSMGATFTDLGVSLCEASKKINDKYRFSSPSKVLPLFVENFYERPELQKKETVDIILMASFYKFKPYKEWNLFNLLDELTLNDKINSIKIIGINETQAKKYYESSIPSKIRFLGVVDKPEKELSRADIYIESFPIGTGLGTLQAIALGCYPIFNPTSFLIYEKGAALNHFSESIIKEYNYINSIKDFKILIDNKVLKVVNDEIDNTRYQKFLNNNNHYKWSEEVEDIYKATKLKDRYEIKEKGCLRGQNILDFAENNNNSVDFENIFTNLSFVNGIRILITFSFFEFTRKEKRNGKMYNFRVIYHQLLLLIKIRLGN